MSEFKNIKVETHQPGICVVKISRPKVLNALNSETLEELEKALRNIKENGETRVLILTGDGDKSFIAGADIAEMKDKDASEGVSFAQRGQEVTKLLQFMSKPTIAAVNGFALGGGTEMAIACDFIWCSDKAVFGQPEVTLGIIPGFGATARLANFVGYPMAKELIYSGRRVKAEEAKKLGLVNQVFASGGFMDEVLKQAKVIAANSASAVSCSKKLLNEFSESNGMNGKLDAEAHEFGGLFGSHDQREGMGAFVEKRKPKFEGLSP